MYKENPKISLLRTEKRQLHAKVQVLESGIFKLLAEAKDALKILKSEDCELVRPITVQEVLTECTEQFIYELELITKEKPNEPHK